jgi:hypothetical protein
MTTVEVEWIDAREGLPRDGDCVLGAITGRYTIDAGTEPGSPAENDFRFVFPMHFRRVHHDEESGRTYTNCFIDADQVPRQPYGDDAATDEQITHWAELPVLPGTSEREIRGARVGEILAGR